MKVVTDKGEGDKYKKNSRDLIIFFSKKARTLLFYILLMWLLQKKGDVCLLEKLYRRTLDIPCSKKVSCS